MFLPHVSCEALTLTNDNIWADKHIDNINSGYMNIDLRHDEGNLRQSMIIRGEDKRNRGIEEVRISGNTAIFHLSSNVVMAYSLSDQKILWQAKLERIYNVWVDSEFVYVKTILPDINRNNLNELHVLAIATGEVKYVVQMDEYQHPIFDDKNFYLLKQNKNEDYLTSTAVWVYEKRTGKKTANLQFKNTPLTQYGSFEHKIIKDKKIYYIDEEFNLVELDLIKLTSGIFEHPKVCDNCSTITNDFLLVDESAYMLLLDIRLNKHSLIQYNLKQQSSQVLYSANYPLYQLLTDGDKLLALSKHNIVEYDMATKSLQERNTDGIFSDLDTFGGVFLTKNAIVFFTDSAMFKVIDRNSLSFLGYIGKFASMGAILAFTKNWLIYIKNGSYGGGPTYFYLYDQSHNNMTLQNQSEGIGG
jgi:hypothetical protein